MNPNLHSEIMRRLDSEFEFKRQGEWLRGGVCPSCHKKEFFTHADEPWVLRCGRLNKCGVEYHVKELYPELFNSWSERYQKTPESPNAAADGYMHDGRGFDLTRVAGWYTQESYYDHKRGIGSATVRFNLPGIGYWERIIDQPNHFGNRKANFNGQYGGAWWQAPGMDLAAESVKEIWITEGIFDSTALLHHDIVSVSALTCNNYPDKTLKELADRCTALGRKRPKLVWALDTGKAGTRYTRQWVKRSRDEGWNAVAAVPPDGKVKLDWNELHQRERLTQKTLDEALYQGALLLANDAHEKALLIYNHDAYNSFYFNFANRMYWFELDLAKFAKAKEELTKLFADEQTEDELRNRAMLESHTMREIANCYFTALYYQANLLTDESWYYLRVDFPHDGASIKNTFTGSMLTSAGEFKKRLLSIAPGAVFTGSNSQLDRIQQKQLFNIKTVQTIDFIGYSREHGAYVFGDIAIKDGKLHQLNEEDFFDLGKLSVKTLNQSVTLNINSDLKDFRSEWINLLWRCYGPKGIVALAFWMGSLFAEQIRAEHKSFPFLEVVGDPGAGKSTLIEFLWKLLGRRDYEGFDPSKSTLAARARNFAQVAGMPVVLIEGDRGGEDKAHAKGFDWDELKTAYNGRSVRSRGVKNGGNETYEPPFRGAIVISQNADVSASPAVLQRIVHIHCDVSSHNQTTKIAAEKLERLTVEEVSGFAIKAITAESDVMKTFKESSRQYDNQLQNCGEIKSLRIIKNHAQIMALVDALAGVIPLNEDQVIGAHKELLSMAVARQQAINSDHPLVQEFWDVFDYLDGDGEAQLNHSRKDEFIAVNLNHFIMRASDKRQQVPLLSDLKRVLKTSSSRKFVDIRTVNSAINERYNARKHADAPGLPTSIKCWVFENPFKGRTTE